MAKVLESCEWYSNTENQASEYAWQTLLIYKNLSNPNFNQDIILIGERLWSICLRTGAEQESSSFSTPQNWDIRGHRIRYIFLYSLLFLEHLLDKPVAYTTIEPHRQSCFQWVFLSWKDPQTYFPYRGHFFCAIKSILSSYSGILSLGPYVLGVADRLLPTKNPGLSVCCRIWTLT